VVYVHINIFEMKAQMSNGTLKQCRSRQLYNNFIYSYEVGQQNVIVPYKK